VQKSYDSTGTGGNVNVRESGQQPFNPHPGRQTQAESLQKHSQEERPAAHNPTNQSIITYYQFILNTLL
jgi:hypothetical protein